MCKIIGVVYFSLFIVSVIECHNTKDETVFGKTDVKLSKHRHHKQRSLTKDNAPKATNKDDVEPKAELTKIDETTVKNEQETEANSLFITPNSSRNTEESIPNTTTEESFSRTGGNTPKTGFKGGLTNPPDTSEKSESYDYSDSSEYKESISLEKDEEVLNEVKATTESGEVLIYAPSQNYLSQDNVLDLKARSGHAESLETTSKENLDVPSSDESMSKIDSINSHNTNMRSGFVPPDYNDAIPKHSDYQQDGVQYKRPYFAYNNEPKRKFNELPNAQSDTMNNPYFQNPAILSPRFFNNKELFYPTPNSHGFLKGQSRFEEKAYNTPYFGLNHPNSQVFSPRNHETCSACFQERKSSGERSFRSAIDSRTSFNTRSIESEDRNAYPLVQDEEIARVQKTPQRLFEAPHPVPNFPLLKHFQPSDYDHTEPIPKSVLAIPSYPSVGNSFLLNRRIGLGGMQRVIFSK